VGESEIGKVMAVLTKVELGDGVVRFVKEEGVIPKDTVTKEEVDQSSQRLFKFLGIAASIFLFFVALILFVGMRSKKRRVNLEGPDEQA
jgi:ABC-type multidrug transport system permease subunit